MASQRVLTRLAACIGDIRLWIPQNQLNLNNRKTEFLFLHSNLGDKPNTPTITIKDNLISSFSTARNLGVLFDDNLTLRSHVTSVCKTVYYHNHHISHIRKFLISSAVKTLVHSLVASRLDYCNSVLAGLPDSTLHKLQPIQNSATRLVGLLEKTDHIMPVLMEWHWLPVCRPNGSCSNSL